MEAGIMSTGAPLDLPKELVGMEYWTSLLVQVRDCPDYRFLFFFVCVVVLLILALNFSCPLTSPLCMRGTRHWLLRSAYVLEIH